MRLRLVALGICGCLYASLGCAGAAVSQTLVGDATRGAALYDDKCGACHSLDANRVGPAHRGVYGRKAGSAPGFDYSPGVKASKVIWKEATLNQWLTSPQDFIPGARMGFRLSDPQQRADVIAFLKRESAVKKP
jgi:cytochrome c